LAAWTALAGRKALAQSKPKRVLYFTRSVGFEHSPVKRPGHELSFSEKLLVEWGRDAGFDVDCTKDGRVFDESLDKYAAIASYSCGDLTQPDGYGNPPVTLAGRHRLLDAIRQGKAFVGIHSGIYFPLEHPDYPAGQTDPYVTMVGGEFVSHARQQEAAVRVASPKFPGVQAFGESSKFFEEWYAMKSYARDLHVILVQETKGMVDACYQRPPFPATWAHLYGKGRVFYTSFGHREDILTNPKVKGLILGGIAWALGNAEADIPPNIQQVTPQADQLKF
jgi:hypothetical protein